MTQRLVKAISLFPIHALRHRHGEVQNDSASITVAHFDTGSHCVLHARVCANGYRVANAGLRGSLWTDTCTAQHHRGSQTGWGAGWRRRGDKCAVAACHKFIGQRAFREILFKNGLPWIFVFDGLRGRDDGTVVIVGDLRLTYGSDALLFATCWACATDSRSKACRNSWQSCHPLPKNRVTSSSKRSLAKWC